MERDISQIVSLSEGYYARMVWVKDKNFPDGGVRIRAFALPGGREALCCSITLPRHKVDDFVTALKAAAEPDFGPAHQDAPRREQSER